MHKVKILFLAANPAGTSLLKIDEEIRAITEKIYASEHRDWLELVSAWAVRPDDLLQSFNIHRPQVVHFSGHGSPSGEILLVDDSRSPKKVSDRAIKALFTTMKDNVRVVILNACYSRSQAKVITEVIDCAIGMSDTIGDQAAIIFAASFYRAVGFGRSVQEAFDQGKTALMLEGISEEDVPELMVRKGIDPAQIFLLKASISPKNRGLAKPLSTKRLAVARFRVNSHSPEWEWAGSLISDFLTVQLQRVAKTTSIVDPQLLLMDHPALELKDLYGYLSVDSVISGSINALGDIFSLNLYLTEVDTQEIAFAQELKSSRNGFEAIVDLQQQAAIVLMRALKTGASVEDEIERFRALPASSLTAYEHYAQAVSFTNQFQRYFLNRDYEAGRTAKQQAIDEYIKALQIDPNFTWALNNLGVIYYSSLDKKEAIECFRKAVRIDPEYLEARVRLAFVLFREYRFRRYDKEDVSNLLTEGITHLERVLSERPNHTEALILQGRIYLAMERYDKAEISLDRAVNSNPRSSTALSWLAACYLDVKKDEKAIEVLEKAIETDPDNARAHFVLGRELLAKGKSELALTQLQQAMRNGIDDYGVDPSYLTYELGRAYLTTDDLDNAILAYEPLFTMNPHLCFRAAQDVEAFVKAHPDILSRADKRTQALVQHHYLRNVQ